MCDNTTIITTALLSMLLIGLLAAWLAYRYGCAQEQVRNTYSAWKTYRASNHHSDLAEFEQWMDGLHNSVGR